MAEYDENYGNINYFDLLESVSSCLNEKSQK